MMYNNKLIACIKANNQILREFNDIVKLPFGTEYTIFIKNLHNKPAKLSIEIDGISVFDKRQLIVEPNSSTEITRFVKDLSTGNSFKFIERTETIENHRGVKAEDGIVRISWKYADKIQTHSFYGNIQDSSGYYNQHSPMRAKSANVAATAAYSCSVTQNDAGITVPGSINNQPFKQNTDCLIEETTEHVMVFKLLGYSGHHLVTVPTTVTEKIECATCGKKNQPTANFCSYCGTCLQII